MLRPRAPSPLLPSPDLSQSQEWGVLKGEEGEPTKAQAPLGPHANSEWSC